ncbi:1531_t:CDS:2 [Entrophospora sp. SA101]|nr:1531_t:CDS:2 [Entrophospora sp. SA101]
MLLKRHNVNPNCVIIEAPALCRNYNSHISNGSRLRRKIVTEKSLRTQWKSNLSDKRSFDNFLEVMEPLIMGENKNTDELSSIWRKDL